MECPPIEMTYYTASRGERNQRLIEPCHLYNVRGDWQVIENRKRSPVQPVPQLRRQQHRGMDRARAERFVRDAEFSPAAYLAQGFLAEHGSAPVEVVVWFDVYQVGHIRKRQWHRPRRSRSTTMVR